MSASGLDDAAHELLDACLLLLVDTDGGVPGRSYVSPGLPADECDQIVVWSDAIGDENTSPLSPAPQSGHRQTTGRVVLATLKIRIIRCVQTTDPQSQGRKPADVVGLESAASLGNQDAWVLWCGLMAMVRRELLFTKCREIHWDSCQAIPTEGNVAGWELTVRVALPGFVPVLGT